MKLNNDFYVDLPVQQAWETLLDIPSIVHCVPGARLLSTEDSQNYKGEIKSKLGPVAVTFQGRVKFVEVDDERHLAKIKASGNEVQGRGNANADVTFKLSEEGARTRVDIATDLNLAGAVAQYGRAQGVVASLAQVIIDQFAANLRAELATSKTRSADGASEVEKSTSGAPSPSSHLSISHVLFATLRRSLSRLFRWSK